MKAHENFRRDCADILRSELASGKISRRQFLRSTAMLGVAVSAGGLTGKARAEGASEVVISNYGGDADAAYMEALGNPFTADTGIDVVTEPGGPLIGVVRKMVDERNVTWDIVDASDYYSIRLDDEYLMPIDYSVVDADALYDWNRYDRIAGSYTFSNVLTYDSSKFDEAPTGWKDFFDLEKFPGKRAMYKWFDGMPEAFMLAAGKSPDEVYPIDMDLVAEMIDSLGDNLVLWDSGGMSQQLFLDEEVVMGSLWNTRARLLNRDTDDRVKWIWNEQIISPGGWGVMQGAPNPEGAMKFIAASQDPERQIMLLDLLGNGPANPAAEALLSDEQRAINPVSHLDVGLVHDAKWYAESFDDELYNWLDVTGS